MNRKDTILIAVVINAGLLAILFTTAIIYDTDKMIEPAEFVTPIVDNKDSKSETIIPLIASASTGDEVDNVLKFYSHPPSQPIVVETHQDVYSPEPITLQSSAFDDDYIPQEQNISDERYTEVTVKKGDVLEKIARANGSTVAAIKEANRLENERLKIGQVLKVPKKTASNTTSAPVAVIAKPVEKKEPDSNAPIYHVVKSGDSPWKIAKQYGVKYEDILKLNHLDEDKAKNLKIGDRIRVK